MTRVAVLTWRQEIGRRMICEDVCRLHAPLSVLAIRHRVHLPVSKTEQTFDERHFPNHRPRIFNEPKPRPQFEDEVYDMIVDLVAKLGVLRFRNDPIPVMPKGGNRV